MEQPRPPRPEEMEELHRLSATCFGFEFREGRGRRSRRVPAGTRVIVADGKPVSHIRMVYNHLSIYGAKVKVVSFGGVCTHPEYRKQGLATRLMEACIEEATAAGATLLIISGARGLYRRAHAVPCGPVWETVLRPGRTRAGAPAARRAAPEDWNELARLHQAEPVRFVRTAAWYAAALSHRHRSLWLLEQAGRAVAYASLAHVWDEHHDHSVRALGEYGGSQAALLEAMDTLLAEAEVRELRVAIPQYDEEFAYLCRSRGLTLTPGTIPDHTIRLLSLPGLLRSLRPYAVARATGAELCALSFAQTEEACRLTLGAASQEMDLTRAGALVFGGPGAPKVRGELGAVLARLFPVPVPLPGLNYT
jgi:predicted N-acetyltransferase YhbS